MMTNDDNFTELDGKQCYDSLRPRWRAFVDALLISRTPEEAYKSAKYRGDRRAASRLLNRPEVWAAYRWKVQQRSDRLEITQDRVLQELASLSLSDLTDITQWDERGNVTFVASDKLPKHVRAAIKSFEVREVEVGSEDSDGSITRRHIKIQMHPKETAPIKLLMTQLGMTAPPPSTPEDTPETEDLIHALVAAFEEPDTEAPDQAAP